MSTTDLEKSLDSSERGIYVSRMFDRIAPRYDLMNRLMSLGQDQRWRRRMAALATLPRAGTALDLATGTGDVAAALLQRDHTVQVVGADFAVEMMRIGQQKPETAQVAFTAADGLALPFESDRFDAVLHAYLMRNIADIRGGFREQLRVLKPGGTVVCLEIVGPSPGWTQTIYHLFFEQIVPRLGSVVSGDSTAYSYLPQSVLRFPDPDNLSRMMEEEGFVDVRYERHMLGTIAIHNARKPQ